MEKSEPARPTVAFHTLGCKVNQHDSDTMAALFQAASYEVVSFHDVADVYVINTCTVTHLSDRKSRQMIRRAVSQNPAAIVVVCGCYAQTATKEVAQIPGVDLIIGTNERNRIVDAVETFRQTNEQHIYLPEEEALYYFEDVPHSRVSSMTRAYVKIQEGCNQFCAYCIIPYARGPLRSRSIADTVQEVQDLVQKGYKEVILTGIHIGVFGAGLHDEEGDLTALCKALLNQTDIARIRLGSIECTEITPELIALMNENPRMARHLHIPLQAGCDRTLARMNRPYSKEDFRSVVRDVRSTMPGIAITTDLMVGFPGETDDDFRESMIFCNDIAFADMHVFKYSMRSGTPAADMIEQVAPEIKEKRAKMIAEIAAKNRLAYQKVRLGDDVHVLLEEAVNDDWWTGHTSNYLRVRVQGNGASGLDVPVHLDDINKGVLEGHILSE